MRPLAVLAILLLVACAAPTAIPTPTLVEPAPTPKPTATPVLPTPTPTLEPTPTPSPEPTYSEITLFAESFEDNSKDWPVGGLGPCLQTAWFDADGYHVNGEGINYFCAIAPQTRGDIGIPSNAGGWLIEWDITRLSGQEGLIAGGTFSDGTYDVSFSGDGRYMLLCDGAGPCVIDPYYSIQPIDLGNKLHRFRVVCDPESIRAYIDGQLVIFATHTDPDVVDIVGGKGECGFPVNIGILHAGYGIHLVYHYYRQAALVLQTED